MTVFRMAPEASAKDSRKVERDFSALRTRAGGASGEVYEDIVRWLPANDDTVMRRDAPQEAVRRRLGPSLCGLHDAMVQAQALAGNEPRAPRRRRG